MIIWLVEDDPKHAKAARVDIELALSGRDFRLYVNQNISWPPTQPLPKLEPDPGVRAPAKPDLLPDIVVLDLQLDTEPEDEREPEAHGGMPQAEEVPGIVFYHRLRDEEEQARKKRVARVIVYSQYRGLLWTENFVEEERRLNPRLFSAIDRKSSSLLARAVLEAWNKVKDGD